MDLASSGKKESSSRKRKEGTKYEKWEKAGKKQRMHVDVFSLSGRRFHVLVNDHLNKIFLSCGQADDLRPALSLGAVASVCSAADTSIF